MPRSRTSAGLLMFRRRNDTLEVLLAEPGEDLLSRARTELEEEVGIPANGDWIELGWVKQKGGKTVYAWAFEGNLPDGFQVCSNNFEMEWPPRSRKMQSFPEVDQACFFPLEEARRKLKEAQTAFLDRLVEALKPGARRGEQGAKD